MLGPDEAWDGPVIVKSNWNFGGRRERRLNEIAARDGLPPVYPSVGEPAGYRIFASQGEVPDAVRDDPGLAIEKFLPERDGDFYVTRFWLFAGGIDHCARVHAHDPIVKGDSALGHDSARCRRRSGSAAPSSASITASSITSCTRASRC